MNDVLSFARPEILSLKPYESARSLTVNGTIFLDANESPRSPLSSPFSMSSMNRYPEPQPRILLDRFSKLYGVPSSMLLLCRGSDEAIDLLVRAFCRPGKDKILTCPPTYGMYEISGKIQGAEIVEVPLKISQDHISLDVEGIIQACEQEKNVKIIFLCSPNNPTGTSFDLITLNKICEAASQRCLVVIDEAYAEFSDKPSMTNALMHFPNLVVLRTLSKAWALAGARFGVAIGQENVVQLLQKIRPPYPLSTPTIETVLLATDQERHALLLQRIKKIQIQREKLKAELLSLHSVKKVFHSSANFLLVRFEDSRSLVAYLKEKGIIVRDRSQDLGLKNCIRITIGTHEENQTLLSTVKAYFGRSNGGFTYSNREARLGQY